MSSKKKISYYYDPEIGNYYYGQGHPMKPHRMRMCHSLVLRYDLWKHLDILKPMPASEQAMATFHTPDYLQFLQAVTPDNKYQLMSQMKLYSLASDCPIFDKMYEYCQSFTGGSIGSAMRINHGLADVAINWAGGMHHAKKSEAAGFCYVNDIVLAILELLKYHARVLYIDIDVHHGDGVEEAFLATDRVLTLSFHKHGDGFFPGTGDLCDVGVGTGRGYSVNVPLKDGMDDDSYESLFKPILAKIMEAYRPGAIVLQSGADSLSGDRLGNFNLTSHGHAACHAYVKAFNVPVLVLGGGGYKIRNVARCWAYETGVWLGVGQDMADNLPANDYYEYFAPDYRLHIGTQPDLENKNKKEVLDRIRVAVLENLRSIHPVSVPFHERPPDSVLHNIASGSGNPDFASGSGHINGSSYREDDEREHRRELQRDREREEDEGSAKPRRRGRRPAKIAAAALDGGTGEDGGTADVAMVKKQRKGSKPRRGRPKARRVEVADEDEGA